MTDLKAERIELCCKNTASGLHSSNSACWFHDYSLTGVTSIPYKGIPAYACFLMIHSCLVERDLRHVLALLSSFRHLSYVSSTQQVTCALRLFWHAGCHWWAGCKDLDHSLHQPLCSGRGRYQGCSSCPGCLLSPGTSCISSQQITGVGI